MNTKIKIAFILPSLHSGGAEKIMLFVAQHINEELFDSTLIITGPKTKDDYDAKSAHVIYLNRKRVYKSIPELYNYLRKHKQDVVLSSIVHLNIVVGFLSILIPKTKFIARESSVIGSNILNHNLKDRISSKLVKYAYKKFDSVICQSHDMMTDLHENYKIDNDKLVIINNPITKTVDLDSDIRSTNDKLKFITIGRLDRIKGYPRLLKILSKVSFDFNYTIIGKGNKEELYKTINKLDLTDKVTYIEFTNDVYKYLNESDLFLQGSFTEGFPNALLESCVTGTPAIVFNAPGGTKEIMEHGINGYIAENEEEFLLHLNNFNINDFTPEMVANSVIKKYNKETIINLYETLFSTIIKNNN